MTGMDFTDRLNSRSRLYGDGRVLSTDHCIALWVDPAFAARFETQISLIVAANLLSRMTTNLAFDIPDVPLHKALPWQNKTLAHFIRHEVCLTALTRTINSGRLTNTIMCLTSVQMGAK